MELIVKQSTIINLSPQKINLTAGASSSTDFTIAKIKSMENFRSVILVAKVLQVNERIQVKPLLEKQDVILSDHTGTIRFTLWQNDIDSLKIDTSYKFLNSSV